MAEGNKTAITAIVVGIVALLIGYFAASAMMGGESSKASSAQTADLQKQVASLKSEKDTAVLNSQSKAANLRVVLNALEREHVELASTAVRSGFDGKADFQAAAKSLDNNSDNLAASVASVYGKDAGDQFSTIWKSHIGFFVDYTVAAKKGDKAGMDIAVKNLMGYVEDISTFLSTANPNLPKQAVKDLVLQHVLLLKGAVDTYGSADYNGSYAKQAEAYNQIGTIADALSGAIVKQKPELFK